MEHISVARIILDWSELFKLREKWRREDLKVIFTNGIFDILHPGHLHYLLGARSRGDRLVVGLNTDASARRLKGDCRPILAQDHRLFALSCLRQVDAVTLFDEETPLRLIVGLMPDILVKGAEYAEEEIVGAKEVKASGGQIFREPMVEGLSTSSIIETIKRRFQ